MAKTKHQSNTYLSYWVLIPISCCEILFIYVRFDMKSYARTCVWSNSRDTGSHYVKVTFILLVVHVLRMRLLIISLNIPLLYSDQNILMLNCRILERKNWNGYFIPKVTGFGTATQSNVYPSNPFLSIHQLFYPIYKLFVHKWNGFLGVYL